MYNDGLMSKSCSCGGNMTIHMHTLIYSAKVKITNVPVYTCQECSRYEPIPLIKRDLANLINGFGEPAARYKYSFSEVNEWARVLKETFAGFAAGNLTDLENAIVSAIQSRIDVLLDIYKFAADCSDHKWMEETALRLSQLTLPSHENAK